MATHAKIINISVSDARATNNAMFAMKHNLCVFKLEMGNTFSVSFNISHVANVTHFRVGTTMSLSVRIVVRTSSLAAFSQVACRKKQKLVKQNLIR